MYTFVLCISVKYITRSAHMTQVCGTENVILLLATLLKALKRNNSVKL